MLTDVLCRRQVSRSDPCAAEAASGLPLDDGAAPRERRTSTRGQRPQHRPAPSSACGVNPTSPRFPRRRRSRVGGADWRAVIRTTFPSPMDRSGTSPSRSRGVGVGTFVVRGPAATQANLGNPRGLILSHTLVHRVVTVIPRMCTGLWTKVVDNRGGRLSACRSTSPVSWPRRPLVTTRSRCPPGSSASSRSSPSRRCSE